MSKGKQGIVINRMYVGNYLSANLGHEIINLLVADNSKHYLYLNPYGNFRKEHKGCNIMLMVKAHKTNTFEVIGLAKGLHPAPGATESISRDYKQENPFITEKQKEYIGSEGISYEGVSIIDLFSDAEQQNIFVTYEANNVYVPKNRRIFLRYKEDAEIDGGENPVIVDLYNIEWPKTALHTFIYSEDDDSGLSSVSNYNSILNRIVGDEQLWTPLSKEKQANLLKTELSSTRISLFDICRMHDDENRISNALDYFISHDAYRKMWIEFFRGYKIDLSSTFTVDREASAKISDSEKEKNFGPTGGRIDLLIKDSNNLIIIENKIKSDINSVQTDADGFNQLHRYINYADAITDSTPKTPHLFILAPNYNVPKLDETASERYVIITYRDICQLLERPDNMTLVESDHNFLALYDVMHRHTSDNPNEYLHHEMMQKFNSRIRLAKKTEYKRESIPNLINKPSNNLTEMASKSAISGEYIISQEDSGTIRVCQIFDNVKGSLREAAKAIGFEYDPNWTTRQLGSKLIKDYGDGATAEIGEYTITKRDSGTIESYRVHGNTIAALRKIASEIGLKANPKWNTRTFGSVLIDYVNGDYNPHAVVEDETGLVVKPDMTIQQLWDAFREMFGGHLRIKKGNKRYDAHYNSSTGEPHEVIDVALSELGCSAPSKFSPDLTVGEFTEKMKDECGLTVVVATSDDWVAVLDDYVLDSVSFIPRNTTKAKMQEILDR